MEVNAVAIQLALLLVPGLLWAMLDAAHRPQTQSGQFVYTLRVFVFGVISYAVVGLIYNFCEKPFSIITFSESGWKLSNSLDELAWAVTASIALSVLWLYGRTYKLVTKILNKIGATNHIADQDIWEFMFNSNDPKIKYVHARDYKNDLIYAGYVRAYSESLNLRELAMYQVVIYTGKSEKITEVPYLYLARQPVEITLEFPVQEAQTDAKT